MSFIATFRNADRFYLDKNFAPFWAEPRGFLPKGSESWRLRSSLCSLVSLPQDTWRRHMLMRTNSPAARVIRGREFYLNFGACSNIQCKALCAHIFWLHRCHLGLNVQLSCSSTVSWIPSWFTTILDWLCFVCVCAVERRARMPSAPGRRGEPYSHPASQQLHNALKLKCKETPEVLPSRETILLCPCLLVFLASPFIVQGCV